MALKAPRQEQTKRVLQVVGPVVLIAGLALSAIGFADFFSGFGDFDEPGGGGPDKFWMAFVGLPLLGIGARITFVAFLGEVARYGAGEVAPVARDTMEYLGAGRPGEPVDCPKCGARNDADATYCDGCGAHLMRRVCRNCGERADADARFCDGCGAAIA